MKGADYFIFMKSYFACHCEAYAKLRSKQQRVAPYGSTTVNPNADQLCMPPR
jgi:hypothetical protein